MALVVAVLLCALAVGRLSGGRLAALGELPLRRRRLVVAALLAQLAGGAVGGAAYAAGLALSALLAGCWLLVNRGTRGTGLVGLGIACNALVVGLNGAMPVSDGAAARAGVDTQAVVAGQDPRHALAGPGTRLRWLADVVPVPLPRVPQVVSPGDVLVAAGLGQLVVAGMRSGPRPSRPARRGPRPPAGGAPEAPRPSRDWRRTGT